MEAEAKAHGWTLTSPEFAAYLDAKDELRVFREKFLIPQKHMLPGGDPASTEDCVYFCGNSLGLQPKETRVLVCEELDKWARRGVIGHMDDSPRPWVSIDQTVVGKAATVVGALREEVAIMNSLTVNLHLLMVPFYTPTASRFKILIEGRSFPSDHYAMCSQIRFHGYDPATALIELNPRPGKHTLSDDDIIEAIEREGDSIALVLLSGVQFYTGQFFDIPRITAAAHAKGCVMGLDLAHAVGNVLLSLHDWKVDFACWCSYKYLNSGPGGIAGAFIHERHAQTTRPRFAGWWGVEPATRFQMNYDTPFQPGVRGLQLSNPPVLQTVSLLASLNVFAEATMPALRRKSEQLTGFLETLLDTLCSDKYFEIITPRDPARRGCQLSLLFRGPVRPVFDRLEHLGVVVDMREPNVMRVAPAPLYNTFADVLKFVTLMHQALTAADTA
eukprot:m.236805 g.236805  ORF g.236805 m.236805 type:complete len:444 (-) comp20783_c0_seq1:25-1356(-)